MPQSNQQTALSTSASHAASISRREVFVWVVAILAANYFLAVQAQGGARFVDALGASLATKSVFHYLGWYAVARLLLDSDRSRPPNRWDIALGLGAALLPFLSWNPLLWISATAVAAYLWLTTSDDTKVRAAAVVLLALSLNGLWAPQLFDLFAYPLLWADTALVWTGLNLTRSGFTWHNTIITSGEHSIAILGPCSSFHNISLGLLCWVSLTKLARPQWVSRDALTVLLVIAAVIASNTARVYLMALSPASYAYWHFGLGSYLFTLVTSAMVAALTLWGAFRMHSRT